METAFKDMFKKSHKKYLFKIQTDSYFTVVHLSYHLTDSLVALKYGATSTCLVNEFIKLLEMFVVFFYMVNLIHLEQISAISARTAHTSLAFIQIQHDENIY